MMPIFNHTPHIEKQTIEPIVASHATNIVPRANIGSLDTKMAPNPHEHVIQGLHVALGMVIPILTHLSIPIIYNYLPIRTITPCGQPDLIPWVSVPPKLHMPIYMP